MKGHCHQHSPNMDILFPPLRPQDPVPVSPSTWPPSFPCPSWHPMMWYCYCPNPLPNTPLLIFPVDAKFSGSHLMASGLSSSGREMRRKIKLSFLNSHQLLIIIVNYKIKYEGNKRSTHSAIQRKYKNIKVLVKNNKRPPRPNIGTKELSQDEC